MIYFSLYLLYFHESSINQINISWIIIKLSDALLFQIHPNINIQIKNLE